MPAAAPPRLLNLLDRISASGLSVSVLSTLSARTPGSLPETHQHSVPTLIACLAGSVGVANGKEVLRLAPGEALAVAPGAWHGPPDLAQGSVCWQVGLRLDGADSLLWTDDRRWAYLADPRLARPLLEALVTEEDLRRRRHLSARLATAVLSSATPMQPLDPALQRMSHCLWLRLHEPITADDILAASGLSPRQAHRRFVAFFGRPPARALLAARLRIASQVLLEGGPVALAACKAGFTDRRTFTRAWRRVHGLSPSAWREGAIPDTIVSPQPCR